MIPSSYATRDQALLPMCRLAAKGEALVTSGVTSLSHRQVAAPSYPGSCYRFG